MSKDPSPSSRVLTIGPYRIVGELGRGSTGVVYEAVQEPLGRAVALKVFPEFFSVNSADRERFEREARLLAQLNHPAIVAIYDAGSERGFSYLAMELVRGTTLDEYLARIQDKPVATRTSADLPGKSPGDTYEAAAVGLVLSILEGLRAIHEKGIVHRDIKPSNLLVKPSGEIKLADFGLAKDLVTSSGLTSLGRARGTPGYMSPEQASGGALEADPRSDLFSIGCLLYQLLTGQVPFTGASMHEVLHSIENHEPRGVRAKNPRVNRDLAFILARLLEKRPHNRYATADAVAQDLRSYLDRQSIQRGKPTIRDRCRRVLARQNKIFLVGTTLLATHVFLIAAVSALVLVFDPPSVEWIYWAPWGSYYLLAGIGSILVAASFFFRKWRWWVASCSALGVLVFCPISLEFTIYASQSLWDRQWEGGSSTIQELGHLAPDELSSDQRKELIDAYWDVGELEKALELYADRSSLFDLLPSNANWYRRWHARLLLALGKLSEAVEVAAAVTGPRLHGTLELAEALQRDLDGDPEPLRFSNLRSHLSELTDSVFDSPRLQIADAAPITTNSAYPWDGVEVTPSDRRQWSPHLATLEQRLGEFGGCPPRLLPAIAQRLYSEGDADRAERYAHVGLTHLDAALPLEHLVDAYDVLARVALDRGDGEDATRWAEQGLKLSGNEGHVARGVVLLWRCYLASDRAEEAQALRARWEGFVLGHWGSPWPEQP